MEAFPLSRYRNLTLLITVVLAQLLLLAWQIKANQDVAFVRTWAVTAVTPLARFIEGIRGGTTHFFQDYFQLAGTRTQNQKLKSELDRLKLENQRLQAELQMADRVRALAAFGRQSPFKFVGARIISSAPGTGSKVVYIDRGSTAGVLKGMSVVTPDGIVGRVAATYPTAAQIVLINDPSFAAGVISQKNRVRGVAKGQGHSKLLVDYIQVEEKVELGEIFFTSGEDRLFPKGLPVGKVTGLRKGAVGRREIDLEPLGFNEGLEEVLVLVEGGHQPIPPPAAPESSELRLLPAPADSDASGNKFEVTPEKAKTDADRLREKYRVLEGGAGLGNGGPLPNVNSLPAPKAPPETAKPGPEPPKPATPRSAPESGGPPPNA